MARHLAIGDIHGCFNSLWALANYVVFRSDDTIITLGDYVNRGPNTRAVIDWLIELAQHQKLVALRGNHDILMMEARFDDDAFHKWIEYGGKLTVQSYGKYSGNRTDLDQVPEEHWRFLEEGLVTTFEIDDYFFVHANATPHVPIDEQPDSMLYWESFNNPSPHESGKIMVCGHTSQKSGVPRANDNAICIDTWAYGRGWLTCLHVESGRIWQANETGETRSLHVDELRKGPSNSAEN